MKKLRGKTAARIRGHCLVDLFPVWVFGQIVAYFSFGCRGLEIKWQNQPIDSIMKKIKGVSWLTGRKGSGSASGSGIRRKDFKNKAQRYDLPFSLMNIIIMERN